MILGPNGDVVAGPLVGEEGILYGTIDVSDCIAYKQVHDVVGYYNRFDIFRLQVDRRSQPPIQVETDAKSSTPIDLLGEEREEPV